MDHTQQATGNSGAAGSDGNRRWPSPSGGAGVDGAPPGDAVLQAMGLAKSFGSTHALEGVDISLTATDSVAITGPSGLGKSTLLHCLAGILRPDQGQVLLHGSRIDDGSERRRSQLRRTTFGFVFQAGQLIPELPADENVALPLLLDGVARHAAVARARQLFVPLGLDGLEGHRPGELSGGQAQRVALARALVAGPAVIFADEPTGSLDRDTSASTMRVLVQAAHAHGAALAVVTHDPVTAGHCTRSVEMRDGRLTAATSAGTSS